MRVDVKRGFPIKVDYNATRSYSGPLWVHWIAVMRYQPVWSMPYGSPQPECVANPPMLRGDVAMTVVNGWAHAEIDVSGWPEGPWTTELMLHDGNMLLPGEYTTVCVTVGDN